MAPIGASSSLPSTASRYEAKVQELSKKTAEAIATSDTLDTVTSIINASRAQQQSVNADIEGRYVSPSALKLIDTTEEGLTQLTEEHVQQPEAKVLAYTELTELRQQHEIMCRKLLVEKEINESLKQELKTAIRRKYEAIFQTWKAITQETEVLMQEQAFKTERPAKLQEEKFTYLEWNFRELERVLDRDRAEFETLKQSVTAEKLEELKKAVRAENQQIESISSLLLEFVGLEPKIKARQTHQMLIQSCKVVLQKRETLTQEKEALIQEQVLKIERQAKLQEEKFAYLERNFRELGLVLDRDKAKFEALKQSVTAEKLEELKKAVRAEKQQIESISSLLLEFVGLEPKIEASPSARQTYQVLIQRCEMVLEKRKTLTQEKELLIQELEAKI